MKNLSREEKIQQRITELEQLIYKKDNALDEEQSKRTKRTFFVLSGIIGFVELCFILKGGTSDITLESICGLIFAPLFVAGLIMFISYGVWFYIMNGALNRANILSKLDGELNALKSEKRNASEDEKTIKELEKQLHNFKTFK